MESLRHKARQYPSQLVKDVIHAKFRYSPDFEDGAFYDSHMEVAYTRTVADADRLGQNLKIIEFGCFTGIVSASMQRLGHEVTASDIDFVLSDPGNKAFFEAESIPTLSHDLATQPVPIPSKSFDLIIFTEVLEHLNFNPLPLLSEFHRILKSGGFIYVATPNLARAYNRFALAQGRSFMNPVEHLRWNLIPNSGMSVGLHWREWTKRELVELFADRGFSLHDHYFTQLEPSRSLFPRKQAVSLMYKLFPSLLPAQVAIFRKN